VYRSMKTKKRCNSTVFDSMRHKKRNLWIDDSESNLSSSSDSRIESKTIDCCLICSIVNSLSQVNCCPKHLAALNNHTFIIQPPPQVIYMMAPPLNKNWPLSEIQSQSSSKSKHHRSHSPSASSSSSLSSLSRPSYRRKRASSRKKKNMANKRIANNSSQHRSVDTQAQVPIYINDNDENDLLILPTSNSNKKVQSTSSQRTDLARTQNLTTMPNDNDDENEWNSDSTKKSASKDSSPRQLSEDDDDDDCILNRIVHVKDDDEEINNNITAINMSKATEQMIDQINPTPKIYLKRIPLEECNRLLKTNLI